MKIFDSIPDNVFQNLSVDTDSILQQKIQSLKDSWKLIHDGHRDSFRVAVKGEPRDFGHTQPFLQGAVRANTNIQPSQIGKHAHGKCTGYTNQATMHLGPHKFIATGNSAKYCHDAGRFGSSKAKWTFKSDMICASFRLRKQHYHNLSRFSTSHQNNGDSETRPKTIFFLLVRGE